MPAEIKEAFNEPDFKAGSSKVTLEVFAGDGNDFQPPIVKVGSQSEPILPKGGKFKLGMGDEIAGKTLYVYVNIIRNNTDTKHTSLTYTLEGGEDSEQQGRVVEYTVENQATVMVKYRIKVKLKTSHNV